MKVIRINKSGLLSLIMVPALFFAGGSGSAAAQAASPANYLDSVKKELRRQWPENRTINLVFHGHSVPSGYFRTPVVRTFDAYPNLVLYDLKQLYPNAVINVILTSIGGENSVQGAGRFARDVLPHRPDVLLIDYALNDRGPGLKKAEAAWSRMIESAQAEGIPVILLTPSPDLQVDITREGNELGEFAEMIKALAAKYHTGIADSYGRFRDLALAGEELAQYMAQSNHPNRKGHQEIAAAIMEYFQ